MRPLRRIRSAGLGVSSCANAELRTGNQMNAVEAIRQNATTRDNRIFITASGVRLPRGETQINCGEWREARVGEWERGRGAEGQRGRGAEEQRGRGAEEQRR